MGLSIRATRLLREEQRRKAEAKAARERERRAALEEWGRLTVPADEVAKHLKVTRRTLQRWANAGRLTPVRLGDSDQCRLFFRRSEVEAMLGKALPPAS